MAGKRKVTSKRKKTYNERRFGKMVVSRGIVMAPEIKHYDVYNAPSALGNANVWTRMGGDTFGWFPSQGADFNQRIGRRIYVKYVELRMAFAVASVIHVPVGGDTIKCEVWMDKECKGTWPANTDIWEPVGGSGLSITAPLNASNLKRFKRLATMVHDVQVTAVLPGAPPIVQGANVRELAMIRIPVNKHVNYSAQGALITDVIDNNMSVWCNTANAVLGSTSAYTCVTTMRVWFSDP